MTFPRPRTQGKSLRSRRHRRGAAVAPSSPTQRHERQREREDLRRSGILDPEHKLDVIERIGS